MDTLAWIVQRARTDGIEELFGQLAPLRDGLRRLSLTEPAARPSNPPPRQEVEKYRLLKPSRSARQKLRSYAERVQYRTAITEIEQAGLDSWIQLLMTTSHASTSVTDKYDADLSSRQRAVTNYLYAFSIASEINCTRIPVEWVRLESPNALAVYVRSSRGAAIGIDATIILELVMIAFAGLDAMRRHDPALVGAVARTFVSLRRGRVDDTAELRLLQLQERVADLTSRFDGLGSTAFQFVLGHELGHLAQDHFTTDDSAVLALVPGEGEVPVSCFGRHSLEFQADAWSAQHLVEVARRENRVVGVVLAHTVPSIYFAAADVLKSIASPTTPAGTE